MSLSFKIIDDYFTSSFSHDLPLHKEKEKISEHELKGKIEEEVKETHECTELKLRLKDKKIVVITREIGGLGDYLCAKKICLYAHEKLGIPLENIALASAANEEAQKILKHEGLNLIKDKYEDIIAFKASLQIFSPVTDDFFVSPRLGLGSPIPTLVIAEYGFKKNIFLESYKNLHAYSFGLDEDSLGFIPSTELRKWSNIKDSFSKIEKLQKLSSVPVQFQKAILGKPYSQEVIEEFSKSSKFYFGYAHNKTEIYSFIEAVAGMNHALKDTSDLTFYFMGQTEIISFLKNKRYYGGVKGMSYSEKALQEAGISKFCVVNALNGETYESVLDPKSKKTIRLVVGHISSECVSAMHMASEDESLVTGDQSFSEVISAGKYPVYERYNHKEKLYKQFYEVLPEILRGEVNFYKAGDGDKWRLSEEIDAVKLSAFFIKRRTNTKIALAVKVSLKHITDTFDFSPRLDRAILKLLECTKDIKMEPVVSLVLPEECLLKSKDIPFDTKVSIGSNYILTMKIDFNGNSHHPEFEDSIFECHRMCDSYQIIRRKKK